MFVSESHRKYATKVEPQKRRQREKDVEYSRKSSSSSSSSDEDEDLETYVRNKGHDDILKRLKSMQLGRFITMNVIITGTVFLYHLGDVPSFRRQGTGGGRSSEEREMSNVDTASISNSNNVQSSGNRTLFHTLLSNATNGHKILAHKLDECVTLVGGRDENDPESALQLDLTPLLEGKSSNQVNIIKDMLDFKNTPARELLLHPVIQTFLEIKWRRIRKVFMVTFLVYVMFLLTYSMYLGNTFYRKLHRRYRKGVSTTTSVTFDNGKKAEAEIFFPEEDDGEADVMDGDVPDEAAFVGFRDLFGKKNKTRMNKRNVGYHLFETCLFTGAPTFNCIVEAILTFTILLLIAQEFLQIFALGPRRYLREFENVLELLVIGLAVAGFAVQDDVVRLKWISAFGIVLAYLELIFLMGRYQFLGGNISLMFYSIVRHLIRSLLSFFVLIVGFAFGFFIIHHKKSTENFENPGKAIAKTLTMSLGEFDFNDLYDAHGKDSASRAFTMVLLVGLAVTGSLVLVNLIVAIIVSDISQLRKEAHLQELINKAQHIIYSEGVLSYVCCFLCPRFRAHVRVNNRVLVCGHAMCRCKAKKLDAEIVSALKNIIMRRRLKEQLESLSQSQQNSQHDFRKDSALVKVLLGTLFSGGRSGNINPLARDNLVDMIIEEGAEIA